MFRIRIRNDFGLMDPGAKITLKNRKNFKKGKKAQVFKCLMFSVDG
jgi:hypothetical protein